MAANYESIQAEFSGAKGEDKERPNSDKIVFWEYKIEISEATLNHIRNTSSIILFGQLSKIVKGVQ